MVKSISVTDQAAIDKLEEVKNQSKYIQDLILKDLGRPDDLMQFEKGMLAALKYVRKSLDVIESSLKNEK